LVLVGVVDLGEHINGLIELGLKGELVLAHSDLLFFDFLFGVIEPVSHREASPSAFGLNQQASGNNVLSPRIPGLVLLGSVIEEPMAAENLLPCLWVNIVIECDKDSALGKGLRDCIPGGFPQFAPGKF